MEITQASSTAEATSGAAEPTLSPPARAIAIFTNPNGAWTGLRTRTQWWFPVLLIALFTTVLTAAIYQRAVVPMISERWDQMVEDGKLTAEQVDKMEQGMRGPTGIVMGLVPQLIFFPIVLMVLGAGVAFGVSFMLGSKLSFRQGFEVVSWANLVMLPAGVLSSVLAWSKETMKGIHLGPGLLVQMSDPPAKWQFGLASFLDAFGPFELWTVALVVIGASTLSGAPRKSVLWVVGGLYVVARLVGAGLAMLTPGAA